MREEVAHWGTLHWHVTCRFLFESPYKLDSVCFGLRKFDISAGTRPEIVELVSNCLQPYLSESLLGSVSGQINCIGRNLQEIDEDICFCDNLRVLNLDNNLISRVPPSITNLTNLETLTLTHNKLVSFDPILCHLVTLRNLSLGGNSITTIPKEIGYMTNLTELHLSKNRIMSIPLEMSTLTNLKKLSLGGNCISDCNILSKLSNLTTLSLYGNPLVDAPLEVLKDDQVKGYFVEKYNSSSSISVSQSLT
eukprot:TRINITY_DN240_c0_g1_i1.p1 TRINITY_DN240_c0_g1~~TRINITY_DN240_c0_g1_i1.p1  ORF type:complete len:250 (+),score=50.71 TRINITY_DN240_c0_g1_i1:695-1444(+)